MGKELATSMLLEESGGCPKKGSSLDNWEELYKRRLTVNNNVIKYQ